MARDDAHGQSPGHKDVVQVINRIGELIQSGECDKSNLRILITGADLVRCRHTFWSWADAPGLQQRKDLPSHACLPGTIMMP